MDDTGTTFFDDDVMVGLLERFDSGLVYDGLVKLCALVTLVVARNTDRTSDGKLCVKLLVNRGHLISTLTMFCPIDGLSRWAVL